MSTTRVKHVIVADAQFLIAEALKTVFSQETGYIMAGVAKTKSELYKLIHIIEQGLLITDISNIDYDGTDELAKIRQDHPHLTILILTNSISRQEFAGLTKAGIRNIIYKTADKDEILSAIEAAVNGKKFYADEILDMMFDLDENKPAGDPGQLTASETEIVRLIAAGLTTKEIAAKRHISYHTVNTHRKNIFRKTEVTNASELIIHAIKAGWIDNIEYYI